MFCAWRCAAPLKVNNFPAVVPPNAKRMLALGYVRSSFSLNRLSAILSPNPFV